MELRAHLGGDGEAGGDGKTDRGHLGEVGALAAEEGLHGGVTVGGAVAETKDALGGGGGGGLRHRAGADAEGGSAGGRAGDRLRGFEVSDRG